MVARTVRIDRPIDRPDLSHPSRGYLSLERKTEKFALGQILKIQI